MGDVPGEIDVRKIYIFFISAVLILMCSCAGDTEGLSEDSVREPGRPPAPFNGRIIFQSNMDGDNEIYLLTGEGLSQLTDNDWQDEYPVWSPDGKRIAYTANPRGNYDIFIMRADGSDPAAVTSGKQDEKEPAWFPDGTKIAYSRERKGLLRKNIRLMEIDIQTGRTQPVIPRFEGTHAIPDIAPEGPLVAFTGKRALGWDSAVFNRETRKIQYLDEGGKSCRARFSKDGKWLAFVSSKEDGKGDIWLMKPDGSRKKRLTKRDETYDYFPSWSPDGRFVVFCSSMQHDHDGDWALYIVDIKTDETVLLFDSPGNDVFPDWK